MFSLIAWKVKKTEEDEEKVLRKSLNYLNNCMSMFQFYSLIANIMRCKHVSTFNFFY